VTRRHVNEFHPDQALGLISADRDGKDVPCPGCGAATIARQPRRAIDGRRIEGRVTLTCSACGRGVTYIDRAETATLS
jgi:predicted RNA-binding Zn-ribbon protein involved in translation (DUF1610 family)